MLSQYKKQIILIFIFLLVFSALAWATSEEDEDDDPTGIKSFMIKKRVNAAYFMLGFGHLQASSLNSFLDSHNLPPVSQSFFSFGMGGHVIHKKVVLGLELVRYFGNYSASKLDYNTSLSARYTMLNLGYLFNSDKSVMYFPYLGVGVGLLKLRVVQNDVTNFDDITKGKMGSDAKRVTLLCNIGFAIDYFHKYNKKKKGKNSPVIGLRVGYLFSPLRADWHVNDISVPMGPNTGIQGPYIRMTIGLGGWIETLIKQAM